MISRGRGSFPKRRASRLLISGARLRCSGFSVGLPRKGSPVFSWARVDAHPGRGAAGMLLIVAAAFVATSSGLGYGRAFWGCTGAAVGMYLLSYLIARRAILLFEVRATQPSSLIYLLSYLSAVNFVLGNPYRMGPGPHVLYAFAVLASVVTGRLAPPFHPGGSLLLTPPAAGSLYRVWNSVDRRAFFPRRPLSVGATS